MPCRMWSVYRPPSESTHRLAGSEPCRWLYEQELMIRDWLLPHNLALLQEKSSPGVSVVLYDLSTMTGTVNSQI